MDKQQEAQAAAAGDSISSVGVTVKDYAPSEVYTNEPPPAYKKPRAVSVQIARLAALTVIACTTILGLCIIASAWIQANASCSQLIHAEALLHQQQQQQDDVADRPSYQALVDPLQSDESSESKQESLALLSAAASQHRDQHHAITNGNNNNNNNNGPSHIPSPPAPPAAPSSPSVSFDSPQSTPIQFKLPLQLDFDDIAGSLMEKNQRSRMNCVVEKKRAEEVMDHQPKMVRLPFGVNITTDPRYEHITGERMAIYCESGQDQRHIPMEPMQQQQQQPGPVVVPMPMNMPMNIPMMIPAASQSIAHHHPHHFQSQQPHINHIPLSMITRVAAQEEQQASQMQKDDTPITIIAREEHVIPIFQQIIPSDVRQAPPPDMRHISPNPEIRNVPEKILYHPAVPEGRMLHAMSIPESRQNMLAAAMESRNMPHHPNQAAPSIPADMVRPPPPPAFHKIPIHVPTIFQQIENQQQQQQQQQQVAENSLDEEMETEPRPHYVQPRSVRSVEPEHARDKRVRRYACECTC